MFLWPRVYVINGYLLFFRNSIVLSRILYQLVFVNIRIYLYISVRFCLYDYFRAFVMLFIVFVLYVR